MTLRQLVTVAFLLLTSNQIHGQAPAVRPSPVSNQSSITVQQIVARQQENYKRIRTAEGEVIWKTDDYTKSATSPTLSARVIFFALEGERSVTLVVTADEALNFPRRKEVRDWSKVLSAALIDGEQVHIVSQPKNAAAPVVRATPYNPAAHENNPLISYHPRMLGDERVPLPQLASVIPEMNTRPLVTNVTRGNVQLLRIDFVNREKPGEFLYYLIRPDQAYLAVEIGKVVGGKYLFRSQIVNGQAKDGTWIPARRDRLQFDTNGNVTVRENWYYRGFSINEELPRRMISLNFFLLPANAKIMQKPQTNAPAN